MPHKDKERRAEYGRAYRAQQDKEAKREYEREYRKSNPDVIRNIQKKSYLNSRSKRLLEQRNLRYAFKMKIHGIKKRSGCIDCGEKDVRILEFHHREPKAKLFTVGALTNASDITLTEELEKCDILCANCHKIRQWEYDLGRGRFVLHS